MSIIYDDKEICNKVCSSDPVNKTAALVTAKGERWNPKINTDNRIHSSSLEGLTLRNVPKRIPNKIGLKFGENLIVVGLFWKERRFPSKNTSGSCNSGRRHRWVCRCKCGQYEVRTSSSINKSLRTGNKDACVKCRKEHYILHGADL